MRHALGLLRGSRTPLLGRGPTTRERKGLAGSTVTPVPLYYTVYDGPSPQPPVIFLHGLFGSKENFTSLAEKIALQTGRKVLMVEARNHGDSPHGLLMSYEAMSADVHLLLRRLRLSRCVLIGHSMGSKTAMVLALKWPELVERLVSIDMSPGQTPNVVSLERVLAAIRTVDIPQGCSPSAGLRLADEQLSQNIQVPVLRQYLLTNLVCAKGRFVWRMDLDRLSKFLKEVFGFPDFHAPDPGPALFLVSPQSGFISSDGFAEIKRLFPKAELQYVPDAGHWIHMDEPQQFVASVCNFLERPLL